MKEFFSIKRFKKRHDEQFKISDDLKLVIAKQNFHSCFILLHISFVVGFTNLISIIISNWGYLQTKTYAIIYFSIFAFGGAILILVSSFIKRVLKSENYIVLNTPFYIVLATVMFCIVFRMKYMGTAITGILLMACFIILILVFSNPQPDIFILIMTIPFVMIGRQLYEEYSRDNFYDLILFYVLLIILTHFKRSVTVKALKSTKILEEKKKILEEEYTKQSIEIEDQALEILRQNRQLIKIQNETIISLSNLVENRDSDTGEHVKRTSKYVNIIANAALRNKLYKDELDYEFIDLVTKSAPLHDIGKIVVPDSILKKPGRLTDEEFNEIKRHTLEGGKIVHDVLGVAEDEKYIKMASDIATAHHEKWNGKGYLYGLKELEIPLSARIMAIADVFDALVSKRCYKSSMSFEEAFDCIKVSSGSHFDPSLVEVFLQSRNDIMAVAKKYSDL